MLRGRRPASRYGKPMPAPAPPVNVADLLAALVRINSVNPDLPGGGSEAAVIAFAGAFFADHGIATRRLPVPGRGDQLLATVPASDPAAEHHRLFDSHVDTVAVDGMTIDPFGGDVRDGKLHGRGACDTKGTAAAMMAALVAHAQRETRPAHVHVLLSLDEECGMTGIHRFTAHDLPELGWAPARTTAVVGEPTELRPVVAHNGYRRWDITFHGRAGHSSVPSESENAISAAARGVVTLERDYLGKLAAEHGLTGPAVGSVNVIRGGSAGNIVPDACTVTLDRRVVPGEDPDAVLPAVAAVLDALDPPVRYTQTEGMHHPPFGTLDGSAWPDRVHDTLKRLGHRGPKVGAPFCTHAGYLDAAGVPTVVLGPGSPHKAHSADEWVEVAQIGAGVVVYAELMALPGAADIRP